MDSQALKTFRLKMANPVNWRKANRVFLNYTRTDCATVAGARRLIEDLAQALNVSLSPAEKTAAATWLSQQSIDPQNRKQRLMLWKRVK